MSRRNLGSELKLRVRLGQAFKTLSLAQKKNMDISEELEAARSSEQSLRTRLEEATETLRLAQKKNANISGKLEVAEGVEQSLRSRLEEERETSDSLRRKVKFCLLFHHKLLTPTLAASDSGTRQPRPSVPGVTTS